MRLDKTKNSFASVSVWLLLSFFVFFFGVGAKLRFLPFIPFRVLKVPKKNK